MKLSVKPVPAARILLRTTPGPGSGMVGCSASSRTSGPPKHVIRTCCLDMIAPYHGSDVIAVESALAYLLNQRSDVRRCADDMGRAARTWHHGRCSTATDGAHPRRNIFVLTRADPSPLSNKIAQSSP